MLMIIVGLSAALAGTADDAPVVLVLDDKRTIRGTVEVAGQVETLVALFNDPRATSQAAHGKLEITDVAVAGTCTDYQWVVPHPLKTVAYVGRLCPTATGSETTLVQSDDFDTYRSSWSVEATDGGARVTYEILSVPSFFMPGPIIRSQIKKAVRESLESIQAWAVANPS